MPAYVVALVFDVSDFQALPHDLCPHANLAEYHFFAHDSFAEIRNVNIHWNQRICFERGKITNFFVFMLNSPDGIDRYAFDPNQTIALNPNSTISNQLY